MACAHVEVGEAVDAGAAQGEENGPSEGRASTHQGKGEEERWHDGNMRGFDGAERGTSGWQHMLKYFAFSMAR